MINLKHGIIRISGTDSAKLLQGIISNDIKKLEKEKAIYTYFLTPQGKYIADFFIIKAEKNDFLIDCALSDKDLLIKKFSMYKLRSDVKITDETEKYNIFQVSKLPDFKVHGFAFPDPRNVYMGCRIIAETLEFQNLKTLEIKEYHKLRIENLVPEGEFDLEKEKSFPLQFRMIENNGVDFKKGCYVGQEVTARTHHRGAIRKTIYKVTASENLENLYGSEIISDDIVVGKLLTAIENQALAQIDVDTIQSEKAQLSVGSLKLKV